MFIQMSTLARPYAEAVFDFAYDHNTLDKWEFMLICAKNIIKDEMFKILLNYVYYIKPFELSEILISIGENSFDCFGQNFIRIMAEYRKLYLIPTILEKFLIIRQQYEMIISLKVITANLLNSDLISKIKFIFEKKFSCKVNLICKLDQSIIGGMIIYINDFVIDGSIRGCVKRLEGLLEI